MWKGKKKGLFLGWVLYFAVLPSFGWADPTREQVEPKHVYVEAQLIQNEIAQIRNEMGKPEPPFLEIYISKAKSREVFFQAITLYQKADRLCFDHTRDTGPIPPKADKDNILPGDVLEVLKKAMIRVNCVSHHWEIPKSLRQPVVNPFTVPSDVFKKILEINQDLNFMLDIPYSPTTVYRRVQETVQRLENLLHRNHPDVDLPELPGFIREKQPRDVYFQIQKNLKILQRISHFKGISILGFFYEDENIPISPGDVYDLVSLLISEIKYLEKNFYSDNYYDERIQKIPFTDRKFPSHVFQKAVYLERLLLIWESELQKSLNWEFELE